MHHALTRQLPIKRFWKGLKRTAFLCGPQAEQLPMGKSSNVMMTATSSSMLPTTMVLLFQMTTSAIWWQRIMSGRKLSNSVFWCTHLSMTNSCHQMTLVGGMVLPWMSSSKRDMENCVHISATAHMESAADFFTLTETKWGNQTVYQLTQHIYHQKSPMDKFQGYLNRCPHALQGHSQPHQLNFTKSLCHYHHIVNSLQKWQGCFHQPCGQARLWELESADPTLCHVKNNSLLMCKQCKTGFRELTALEVFKTKLAVGLQLALLVQCCDVAVYPMPVILSSTHP